MLNVPTQLLDEQKVIRIDLTDTDLVEVGAFLDYSQYPINGVIEKIYFGDSQLVPEFSNVFIGVSGTGEQIYYNQLAIPGGSTEYIFTYPISENGANGSPNLFTSRAVNGIIFASGAQDPHVFSYIEVYYR